jgi:hypothetical protein
VHRLSSPVALTIRIGCVALLGALASSASAQSRPSFAGEWVMAVDTTRARPTVATAGDVRFRVGDMGTVWGSPLTIRQTADTLVAQFVHFSAYDLQPPLRYRYALDGSESRNTVMISHTESMQRSRTSWQGSTLVIVTTYPGPAGAGDVELRQALSLSAAGELVIETTRPHGAAPNVVRATYRRR